MLILFPIRSAPGLWRHFGVNTLVAKFTVIPEAFLEFSRQAFRCQCGGVFNSRYGIIKPLHSWFGLAHRRTLMMGMRANWDGIGRIESGWNGIVWRGDGGRLRCWLRGGDENGCGIRIEIGEGMLRSCLCTNAFTSPRDDPALSDSHHLLSSINIISRDRVKRCVCSMLQTTSKR